MLGIDPKVDYAFKRVFGLEKNRDLLVSLIDSVLAGSGYARIVDLQICNPFNDKEWPDDKLSILDIKARDAAGKQFNVEMQMLLYSDLPERLLYYWATLFTDQLSEGLDYSLLQPTLSICFLNQSLFPEAATFHSRFQLVDSRFGHCLTDRIEMHLVELPKFTKAVADLAEDLDQWLYFLCHGADLEPNQLPDRLSLPEVGKAIQELEIMNQTNLERERYLARQKAQRDELWKENWYKRQHTEGLEKGRQEGRQEGLVVGEIIGEIRMCQSLLSLTPEAREVLAELPESQLSRKLEELKAQVLAKR